MGQIQASYNFVKVLKVKLLYVLNLDIIFLLFIKHLMTNV